MTNSGSHPRTLFLTLALLLFAFAFGCTARMSAPAADSTDEAQLAQSNLVASLERAGQRGYTYAGRVLVVRQEPGKQGTWVAYGLWAAAETPSSSPSVAQASVAGEFRMIGAVENGQWTTIKLDTGTATKPPAGIPGDVQSRLEEQEGSLWPVLAKEAGWKAPEGQ